MRFNAEFYGVSPETEFIDCDACVEKSVPVKPKQTENDSRMLPERKGTVRRHLESRVKNRH